MKVENTRFGSLDIADDKIITFPEGLPGFEGKRYAFVHDVEHPVVQWLQSIDEPDVALMTIDPVDLGVVYEPKPKPGETRLIRSGDKDDEIIYRVIIRVPEEHPDHLYLNLFAPVYINVDRRLGMQVPLVGSGYNVRELWPPEELSQTAGKDP
ncbi:MAG: flagellar assembly protein FliW [Deltaproteobacteria bacterium]